MPGMPPEKVVGKSVNKTILNGLFQQSTYTCTMMGMPFEGRGTLAYDNHKKLFVSSWIDNMGSGMMNSTGTWDDATKTITLTGKMMDAGTKQEKDFRETLKIVDDKTQLMEMFQPGADGKEMKWMEIKYTRK
jgi:hypothetical protein